MPKLALVVIAFIVALSIYSLAPLGTPSGPYSAYLTIPNPNNEDTFVNISFIFTLSDSASADYISEVYNFSNFVVRIKYRHSYLLKPGEVVDVYVSVTYLNGTFIKYSPERLKLEIRSMEKPFSVTIRPTKIIGKEYYFVYHPLVKSNEAFFILFLIAFLWFTEAIPLAGASLLIPIFAVVFQISTPSTILSKFFSPSVVLIIGGLFIGRALQKHQLDKRLALKIVSKADGNPHFLMLTMMYATAFLSFWISNTASAAVMLPIGLAVVAKVGNGMKRTNYGKVVVLGIAYSATIGGIATLIGTPPNLVAAGILESVLDITFSFVDWIPFGLPFVIIFIPIVYKVLTSVFKPESEFADSIRRLMNESEKELKELGPMDTKQKLVLSIFALTIILWFTEKIPDFIANIIGFYGHGISSSIVALIGVGGLFIFGLLDEEDIQKISWTAALIIGGGLALGEIIIQTGVSDWIAQSLGSLQGIHPLILNFIVGALSLIITMFASNTAAAAILVPIAIPLAIALGMDPLLITITIAIAASLDFALPVGTPPSTLAYSTGMVKMKEMLKVGLILDILSLLLLTLGIVWLWIIMGLVYL
ncbi:MAG: SLC13 family permease [Candidatus Asgardarchaeia archaeon]